MNKITFIHNWNNKLNNEIFTTIRKYTDEKEQYYFNKLGEEFEIHIVRNLKDIRPDMMMGFARLISVETKVFKDIPKGLLHSDSGLTDVDKITEVFKRFGINEFDNVLILTFSRQKYGETEAR